jgi:hypothetical protein
MSQRKLQCGDSFVHDVLERFGIETKSANCNVLVSFNFVDCNGWCERINVGKELWVVMRPDIEMKEVTVCRVTRSDSESQTWKEGNAILNGLIPIRKASTTHS